ncbi:alpha-L-fucosidase [Mucilaginibacter glaciei]|uniref:alpha-L-fucosidase n=1 Tax=Mucilaginibacter glaciei TaxID=2772109 RepID=A0A926S1S7_9SPHI|nr:alpha-L-fucosidase [Mucilaginibacter glaciei]MBD1393383.1 alpha-L-fucosidase [Mucilaginibacter glaciei]
MKNIFLSAIFLASALSVTAQVAPKPYGVLPTQRQLNWQETDMYCIVHFSMATFTDKEWGYGDEDPKIFNPKNFSALQIVGAAKAGGFKGIVVVAKHHDGFCLWPTKTTDHNISKSPYKSGKGDILKDYQLACQKLGMKMAVYCSPWDRNNALYGKPEYVTKVYREQLKELYKNYGPVFMSWHDGANGGDGYYGGSHDVRKIDRSTYYGWDTTWAITRKMQPGAAIFGDVGPDVRWVGNEEGHAGETYWATYTPHAPEEGKKPANGFVKDYEGTEGTRNGQYWMPAECDVPLRRGWFYHASQDGQSRSAYTLVDLYYKSVGRGAALDLGLSPDKDGVITNEDVNILKQFGSILKQTFAVNLAKGASFKASNLRGNNAAKYGTAFLTDNSRYTYWATDDKVITPELVVDMHTPKTFNVIRLRENIKLGQRIEGAAFDAWIDGAWKEIATVPSVGANRLVRLPYNVTASKLRLRITKSPVSVAISDFGVFKEPSHLVAPIIKRNIKGEVNIYTEAPVSSIRYTTNGSEPTTNSSAFTAPFLLPDGGLVKAKSFEGNQSAATTATFSLSKQGWKVETNEANGNRAVDEDDNTFLSSSSSTIIVDMGAEKLISSFTYLPRQDKKTEGMVSGYAWATSTDGANWQTVAEGEFSNIKSNPVEQLVALKSPVKARYFKLTATKVISGEGISAAELGASKN